MNNQQSLFDSFKLTKVEGLSKMPTRQAYAEFNKANPWVIVELEKIVWEMVKHGRKKVGMRAAVEIFRWETRRHTISKDFKINNNFCALYARDIMARNPHLGQIFELRRMSV